MTPNDKKFFSESHLIIRHAVSPRLELYNFTVNLSIKKHKKCIFGRCVWAGDCLQHWIEKEVEIKIYEEEHFPQTEVGA